MSKPRYVFFTVFLLKLLRDSSGCGIRYVPKSASQAYREQEEAKRAENDEYDESFAYEDSGSGEGEDRQCMLCDESGLPRFFFADTQEETGQDLPCCSDNNSTQLITRTRRLSNATQCGKKRLNRILGGVLSSDNEFPWHCALLKPDMSFYGCSAVLLSCDPVIIITAAHCFSQDTSPDDVIVSCGASKINRPGPSPMDQSEVRVAVSEIVIHPDFSWLRAHHPLLGDNAGHPIGLSLFENDIAVIKLQDESEFECKRKVIWPACLPTQNETYEYWFKTGLAGWGQTVNDGNVSTSLLKVAAPIVSDKTCQERVCNFNFGLFKIQNCIIADNHICAGGLGGKGPCKGDSGGALLAQDQALSGWSAVGLVSYQPGRVCGTDQYVVYTEISKYMEWIADQYNLLPPQQYEDSL